MSMSTREILMRFQQGKPLTRATNLGYTDDDTPDLRTMDMVDIDELKMSNQQHIVNLKREIDHKQNLRKSAKDDQQKKAAKQAAAIQKILEKNQINLDELEA